MEANARQVLLDDAKRIRQIITKQSNVLCIAKCKAFEEVIDTQLYGFSCKVNFAIQVGLISKEEGRKMLFELENELNLIYENIKEGDKIDEAIK